MLRIRPAARCHCHGRSRRGTGARAGCCARLPHERRVAFALAMRRPSRALAVVVVGVWSNFGGGGDGRGGQDERERGHVGRPKPSQGFAGLFFSRRANIPLSKSLKLPAPLSALRHRNMKMENTAFSACLPPPTGATATAAGGGPRRQNPWAREDCAGLRRCAPRLGVRASWAFGERLGGVRAWALSSSAHLP